MHAHARQLRKSFEFPTPCSKSEERPAKMQRMETFELGDTDDNTVHDRDEISKYLHAQSLSFKSELLEFWKGKECNYPKLDKLARKILAIPATSASSERNFRAVGYIMQELCTLQKPESMDNLLFLHNNL